MSSDSDEETFFLAMVVAEKDEEVKKKENVGAWIKQKTSRFSKHNHLFPDLSIDPITF